MSGPTGPIGFQGIQGPTGSAGPIGLTGIRGIQGPAGVTGPAGGVGIAGSTGIQLSNNGTLAQCASIRNTVQAVSTSNVTFYVNFNNRNPSLTGSNSTSISGQYDLSGLNYYSSPVSFPTSNILIPGGGNYYISSVVETNRSDFSNASAFATIGLYAYDAPNDTYTLIVPGTAGRAGTDCYLYHYYSPAIDTQVAIRADAVSMNSSGQFFTDVSTNFPNGILSIVKIW